MSDIAVIPIVVGPLQVLLAMLPAIAVGVGTALIALFKPRTLKLVFRLLWRTKVTLLIAAGILAAAYYGLGAIWPHGGGSVGAAEAAGDWPMFRGNPRRTGAVPGSAEPGAGGVQWTFNQEFKTFYSSPSVVGNRLYATAAEVGVFSTQGAILCLDADTGGVVWRSAPPGYRATFSSPAVSGKYLVVGEGLHTTRDARVVCLDVEKNGAVLWTFRTKSHVESTPVIADGHVFIGAGDDGYRCFKLEPDAAGNPVEVWHLAGDKYPDAETSPVFADGKVYFGLGIGGQAVVCVEAATGRELWRVATPAPVFAAPTISDGKLYIGMGFADFVNAEEQAIENQLAKLKAAGRSADEVEEARRKMFVHGEVWCIDLATHAVDWKFQTDRTVLNAIAAGADRLYVGTRGGTVYALGLDGKPAAQWKAASPIIASPALTENRLYVVTDSGRLFGLDRASLQPAWEASLGAGNGYLSSPAVARGHVYVGTPESGLLCVGVPATESQQPLWSGELGGPGRGGWIDGSPLPDRGALLWRYPGGTVEPPRIVAPVAVLGDRLYVPITGGARKGLASFPAESGKRETPQETWFVETLNGVEQSPAATDEIVAIVDGAMGDAVRRLRIVDAATGEPRWSAPVSSEATGKFLLERDAVLIEDEAGKLTRFSLDGKIEWRVETGAVAGVMPVGSMLFVAAEKALLTLDLQTGRTLWRTTLASTPIGPPVVRDSAIYLAAPDGISAYRLVDGARTWTAETGAIQSSLVLGGDVLAAANAAGEMILVDANDGSVRARLPGALPLPPVITRGALLYATKDALVTYSFADGKSERWMATGWLGAQTSPLVLADSAVYFATDKRGLIKAGRYR